MKKVFQKTKSLVFLISSAIILLNPAKASWEWNGNITSLINAVIDGAEETMGKFAGAPPVDLKWCKEGTFYNIKEKYICFQPDFMRQLATIGDAAVAFVAAHEYAHHIVHSVPDVRELTENNILREELQADCFAGTILASLKNIKFDENDVREMLFAADLVGDKSYDDYLKHHGSGENRALALRSGLRFGATREKDLYFTMFCSQD